MKIKAASLAAEATIIRKLERRLKRASLFQGKGAERRRSDFFKIQGHRRFEIRTEARATHIARAFLKGQAYSIIEHRKSTGAPFTRACAIATKYAQGDKRDIAQAWEAWLQEARAHLGA